MAAAAADGATAHRGEAGRHGDSTRHLFTVILIVLAVLVCVLWWQSRAKVDALVLFVGGDGRAQVLGSSDGRVCIALTNLRFGRERAWTAICGQTNVLPAIVDD